LLCTLDTHCHADHVTGAWLMKHVLGSKIGLATTYGASNVDLPLAHGQTVRFGDCVLEVRSTPGHTDGCLSFIVPATSAGTPRMVFTGDALLVRGAGRTDFQHGDAHKLYHSIKEQLFTLPDDCIVYPAHDYEGRTSSTIAEERAYNPRIGGGAREEDFVGYMHNMKLPHPKQLAVALPANMRSGEPEHDKAAPEPSTWGPVVVTYAGVPEVQAEWVALHRDKLRVLDVRTTAEFDGELGHVEGAQLVPLDDLRDRLAEVEHDKPVVVVCRSGRRSAMGTQILTKAGIKEAANLAGGMVRWRDLGLPVASPRSK
jgi:glyoxylase-like metal-dependent hydrolase (beta-lactamase superfamily II)/rhodanese-related sulfurtransferase